LPSWMAHLCSTRLHLTNKRWEANGIDLATRQFEPSRLRRGPADEFRLARPPHSPRSFFKIAFPVSRLDVFWMVVAARRAHAFGLDMIRYDVVVTCEEPLTNPTSPILLDDLAIQQSSHLRW